MGWKELTSALTVGRQRECDVCLIDSRVSRTHCRLEPDGEDWAVVDLQSRNGTWCDGISVDRILLMDGDQIHLGKAVLTYHEGILPEKSEFKPRTSRRPADPHEALADTIAGVTVMERPRDPWLAQGKRAQPRPIPRAVGAEESGSFAAVLELPEEIDQEKPLRSYRPPRVRPLPKPILMEIPQSPQLAERPRRKRSPLPDAQPTAIPIESRQPLRINWSEWGTIALVTATVSAAVLITACQWWMVLR